MRVCHVSPHLPPDQAANALLPAHLGQWQRDRGDTVSFVALEPAQGGRRASAETSVTEIPRRRPTGFARRLRLDALAMTRVITRALEQQRLGPADTLHLHSNGLIIEAAARFARRHRIPYVLTMYGTEIWHYRRRWPFDLFTAAYDGAGAVTFYSRLLKARASALGLDRSRMEVVYPAVSDQFQPAGDEERARWREALGIREPRVIVNVKRLHELAGQRYLIDAFARIAARDADVRLVICGTGALRASLEQQARALGVAARVTFTGLVDNDLVARYSALAAVFALPSLLEALPTVAVEALAAGTPVVSADHPGGVELHELFGDDVHVVPKQDVPALAAALSSALASPRRVRPETTARLNGLFRPPAVLAEYDRVYALARERT